MSRIRGKNTRLEREIRRQLSLESIRYRLQRDIYVESGSRVVRIRPDFQNKSGSWAIFANGCFWHAHADCKDANQPKGGRIDWRKKLDDTKARDERNYELMLNAGWRVLVLWECGLKYQIERFGDVFEFFHSDQRFLEWPPIPPRRRKSK